MLVEPVNPHDPESVRRCIDRLSGGKIEQKVSELDSVVTSGVDSLVDSAASSIVSHLESVVAITETALSDATSEVKASALANFQTNSNLISAVSNVASANTVNVATISDTLSAVSDLTEANSQACSSLQTDVLTISNQVSDLIADVAANVVEIDAVSDMQSSLITDMATISDTLSAVSDLADANSAACSSLQTDILAISNQVSDLITDIAIISNTLSAVSDLAEATSNAASLISNLAQANSAAINSIESTLSSVIASVETGLSQATSDAYSLATAVDSNDIFVDRGDPSAPDFSAGDLITDNTWRDLDLSAIVPAGATAVLLGVVFRHGVTSSRLQFRKNGNANVINVSDMRTQGSHVINNNADAVVACDVNRIIEYRIVADWTSIDITVKGWWVGDIFVDRGDPVTDDFSGGDFTTDGTWRDLDLSGIVPVGASAILLRIAVVDGLINQSFSMRENGNNNQANVFDVRTQTANNINRADAIVTCDVNRIIEYKASNIVWTGISVTVGGWWIGGIFMAGGDPVTDDFSGGDFTTDGTWRDLDLSGIVPAGTIAVALKVQVKDNLASALFSLRKNGNSNSSNSATIITQVTNQSNIKDVIVACDFNRVIEYWASNTAWSIIGITVKGWWTDAVTVSHLHSTALSLATMVDSAVSDVVATAVTETASLATAITSVESSLSSVIVSTATSIVGHMDSAITSTAKVLSDAASALEKVLSDATQTVERNVSNETSEVKASAYVNFQTNSNLISNLSNTLSALSVGELDAISDMASANSNALSAVSNLTQSNATAVASIETLASTAYSLASQAESIASTHKANDGADHNFIDQSVTVAAIPTFAGLIISGAVDILHTAIEADDHALELEVNAAAFGDVKALEIAYTTDSIAQGQDEGVILLNIDRTLAVGGEVFGLEALATEGSAAITGLKVGAGVAAVHQDAGTFINPTTGMDNTSDVAVMIDGSIATTTTIFEAVNEYIIIGAAAVFEEIEFILTTPTSNPGIKPTFWYSSAAGGGFTQFTPTDGTDGFRHTGVVAWDASDLVGHIVGGVTGTFDIKIIRTKTGSLSPSPVLGFAKTAATTEYVWDENGDANLRNLALSSDLAVEGASVTIGKASTTTGTVVLHDSNSANTITITIPDISAGSLVFTLPATDGDNANVLQTDGNGVTSWVAVVGGGVGTFVDRGDPAAWDYDITGFNIDGTWYDLDLSAVVPAGAKAVLLAVYINTTAASQYIYLRKNGNSNEVAMAIVQTTVAGLTTADDVIVACDSNRKIEYNVRNLANFNTGLIAIKGWWT